MVCFCWGLVCSLCGFGILNYADPRTWVFLFGGPALYAIGGWQR